jgi:hypothetical protein
VKNGNEAYKKEKQNFRIAEELDKKNRNSNSRSARIDLKQSVKERISQLLREE